MYFFNETTETANLIFHCGGAKRVKKGEWHFIKLIVT